MRFKNKIYSLIFFVIVLIPSFSCNNEHKQEIAKTKDADIEIEEQIAVTDTPFVTKFTLDYLDDSHPNKNQISQFLTGFDKKMIAHSIDKKSLSNNELIISIYDYEILSSETEIIFLFCNDKDDAKILFESNFMDESDPTMSILYEAVIVWIIDDDDKDVKAFEDTIMEFLTK